MRKINEIFYSLQGEGSHAGVPSVFVRFSGCNLRCGFCDTRHESGKMMSDEEIAEAVNTFPARWIILTGGEPSLFIDEDFIRYLKENTSKYIAIETNGTNPLPEGIDWVTVSPKSGMEGGGEYNIRVRHANELKVVDVGQPLEPYFSLPCVDEGTEMFLQPCFVDDEEKCRENRLRAIRRVLEDPRWTLSVQIHRYLDIP